MGGNGSALDTIKNPIPQLSDDLKDAVNTIIKGHEVELYMAPVQEVSITDIYSLQPTITLSGMQKANNSEGYPVIVSTLVGNVVVDGNHRVARALSEGRTSIAAHYSNITDYIDS
jgi:hypothetical protein